MGNRRVWVSVALLVALGAVSGCGRGGGSSGQAEVKGRVTFNGTPVAAGTLNMIPVEPTGNKVSVPITAGDYIVPKESGPDFGKYRVEIYAFEPLKPPSGAVEGDAEAASATRQIIPPKFNQQSTLELDVDAAEMQKDFELSSQ